MTYFSSKKITSQIDIVATKLKSARLMRNLTLDQISSQIGIKSDYLEALETGEINLLPKGVYAKNYLREYARQLDLDADELLETMESSSGKAHTGNDWLLRQTAKHRPTIVLPKIFKALALSSAILICLGYVGVYLKNLTALPHLEVFTPSEDITTDQSSIVVTGTSEPEAKIIINGEAVLNDQAGQFVKPVNLKNGLNVITITAQKKYGQENIIKRQVLVKGG